MQVQRIVHERINGVSRNKVNGRVMYVGFLNQRQLENLLYVKPYNQKDGYQRPESKQRVLAVKKYLGSTREAIIPPLLLNANSEWEFVSDSVGSDTGYLICGSQASIIDGQHRVRGLLRYLAESPTEIRVPFCAWHHLGHQEEIDAFTIINTTARPLTKSLSIYLQADEKAEYWIATKLLSAAKSPFKQIGTITGQRNRTQGIRITLQNVEKIVELMTKEAPTFAELPKQHRYEIMLVMFRQVHDLFPDVWKDYQNQRLTHTVGLNALAIALGKFLSKHVHEEHIDVNAMHDTIQSLLDFDWSVAKYQHLSGMKGARELAMDIVTHIATHRGRDVLDDIQKSS